MLGLSPIRELLKLLQPLQFVIGSGFYCNDITAQAKNEVLQQIASTRYGVSGDGYLFSFQYDGLYLSHIVPQYIGQNLIDITDPNGVQINKEIVRTCKNGGGYVQYVWDRYKTGKLVDKISYVRGYDDWQWVIGTGFYLDDLQQELNAHKKIFVAQQKSFLRKIGLLSVLLYLLSAVVIKIIVRKFHNELSAFHNFFRKSASQSQIISLEKTNFIEFHLLAENANKMLTDREQAEEELRESEEKYHCLSDAAFEGILITHEGIILEVNSVLCKMLGYQSSELIGKKAIDLVASEERENVKSKMLSGYEQAYESSFLREDGSTFPIDIHAKLFAYKGQEVRVTAVRDISAQKRAEEEIKRLRGILPLCSFCKKVRDDKGYWEQVDVYISKYSEADISHSICPECVKIHYPEYSDN